MTIHYNNALHPEKNIIPACHQVASDLRATADLSRVTCKKCLRLLKR
jgi:hypothetical protein